MYRLYFEQIVNKTLEECWDFFSNPGNLEKLTPPDLNFIITSHLENEIYPGQIITYRIKLFPLINVEWVTEITHVSDKLYFIDEQRFGPYKFWQHLHRFTKTNSGTKIEDIVSYKMPFGILGKLTHFFFIRKKLENIFRYRNEVISRLDFSLSG